MRAIFLRGSIPPVKEHPEKLLYSHINECEDMWTQLFYFTLKKLGAKGELIYQGGVRRQVVSNFYTEKWVPSLKTYSPNFSPDLIICRGGFPYYDEFVTRFPRVKKIYYGAGVRYYPQTKFTSYDLFLVDSKKQKQEITERNKKAELFIKPAALLFRPIQVKKEYDVCFVANAAQSRIKRHKLLIRSLARTNITVLNIGNTDKEIMKMADKNDVKITWSGWSLRKFLPEKISSCRMGVCCSTNYDSCPRVIPEYLACRLPVVVTQNVNFWHDKYITPLTGILSPEDKLLNSIRSVLEHRYEPRDYYDKNVSMDKASEHLTRLISNVL